MPRYFLGGKDDSGEKRRGKKHELSLDEKPADLYVNNLFKFEKAIKSDFKYVWLDTDPLKSDIQGIIGDNPEEDAMLADLTPEEREQQAYEFSAEAYGDLKGWEVQELDMKGGRRLRLFHEFITQAAEPGDKLFKVMQQNSGEAIFVLCPPEKLDELKRIETLIQRQRVSKHLKGK